MKSILLTILLPLSLLVSAETHSLKVMTYNLRFGELATLEQLAEYINKENPDVVALQEVDCNTKRKLAPHINDKDMLSTLAYLTNRIGIYGKTINYSGGYYGIGILSKYPIVKSERFLLPNPEKKEPRALLIAEIELNNGDRFNFVTAHLDVNPNNRKEQIDALNTRLLEEPLLTIVAGDFNGRPEADDMVGMKQWIDALPTTEATFPTKDPKYKIDYIYYRPKDKVTVIESLVDKQNTLSDHLSGVSILKITL